MISRCSYCRHWQFHEWERVTPHMKKLCAVKSEAQKRIDGGAVLTSAEYGCEEFEAKFTQEDIDAIGNYLRLSAQLAAVERVMRIKGPKGIDGS